MAYELGLGNELFAGGSGNVINKYGIGGFSAHGNENMTAEQREITRLRVLG